MRKKISDLALAAMLLALSFPAHAQQAAKKIPRIGIPSAGWRRDPNLDAFQQGLHKLGWVDGKTLSLSTDGRRGTRSGFSSMWLSWSASMLISSSHPPSGPPTLPGNLQKPFLSS